MSDNSDAVSGYGADSNKSQIGIATNNNGSNYPVDGKPPTTFSIDLDNHSSSSSPVKYAPWLVDTATYNGVGGPTVNQAGKGPTGDPVSNEQIAGGGGYGYDPFSGFHWASNVIESPVTDPNYTGQYFYYGAQIGGRTFIEPAMIGGHWAAQLGTLTPFHLDLALQPDGQTYNVTSSYHLTQAKGMNIGNNVYTYGPNGFQWQTISPQLQSLMNSYGQDKVTSGISAIIASNNLVPTQVTLLSQFQTPDGNNYTVVQGVNPGYAAGSATGTAQISLQGIQKQAVYVVTSSPLDYRKTFDPYALYNAVMNSPNVSSANKALYSQTVSMTTGDSGSGTYPAFIANILSYGITAALSGQPVNPVATGGFQYTSLPAGLSDAIKQDLGTIDALVQSGAVGGIPGDQYSCFLPGVMIDTDEGRVPVETLQIGQRVCVRKSDGTTGLLPIARLHRQHVVVDPAQSRSSAGWPVIIVKDAFSKGVPSEDMRVTAEHCFYFEGRLVPVRMLVNDTSIRYDYECHEYDYYHFATDPHSIIWANGALTESWLDTATVLQRDGENLWHPYDGKGAEVVELVDIRKLSWEQDAAAPLEVGRDFVEPLYYRLSARGAMLAALSGKKTEQVSAPACSVDCGVYLKMADGSVIRPMRRAGRNLFFRLPAWAETGGWLCSTVSQPSEQGTPFIDDRRYLGRLIGAMSIWDGASQVQLTDHLTCDDLPGWFAREEGPYRWTMGQAALHLPERQQAMPCERLLVMEIVAGDPEEGRGHHIEMMNEVRTEVVA